jgi:hypothetical protein
LPDIRIKGVIVWKQWGAAIKLVAGQENKFLLKPPGKARIVHVSH